MAPSGQKRKEEPLTETEGHVMQLVADGMTNRQVARRMARSHHTVNYHLRRIFRKLNLRSRVELTKYFYDADHRNVAAEHQVGGELGVAVKDVGCLPLGESVRDQDIGGSLSPLAGADRLVAVRPAISSCAPGGRVRTYLGEEYRFRAQLQKGGFPTDIHLEDPAAGDPRPARNPERADAGPGAAVIQR